MEATQRIIRIYGIEDEKEEKRFLSYFQKFKDKKIEKDNFPLKNEKIQINIGKPNEHFFKANKVRLATGTAILKRIYGLTDIPDFKMLVKNEFQNLQKYPKASNYKICITLVHEKQIQIDDNKIKDNECYWLNLDTLEKIKKESIFRVSNCFNLLINYLSSISDITFFNNKVLNDLILISSAGKREIGVLSVNVSAKARATLKVPLDYDNFEKKLDEDISSKKFKKFEKLGHVFYFRLAAIGEKDPWKHYYFSFSALETLIERSVKNIYREMVNSLTLNGETLNDENIPFNLTKDVKEFNLKDRFGILALHLFPKNVKEDYALFKDLKDKRDSMSHGRPLKMEELPVEDIDYLLTKYLNKIMEIG